MVMLNKEYMINHMRNENGSINIKNVVLAATCEATELFQCLIVMDSNFTDWSRFVDRLEKNVEKQDYEKVHENKWMCCTCHTQRSQSFSGSLTVYMASV